VTALPEGWFPGDELPPGYPVDRWDEGGEAVEGLSEVADLVAEMVRRTDAAEARALLAEAQAEKARADMRVHDLEAELYRQLRSKMKRWIHAGAITWDVALREILPLVDHENLTSLVKAASGG